MIVLGCREEVSHLFGIRTGGLKLINNRNS